MIDGNTTALTAIKVAKTTGVVTYAAAAVKIDIFESFIIGLIAGIILFSKEMSYLSDEDKLNMNLFKAAATLLGTIFVTVSVGMLVFYGGTSLAPYGLGNHIFWASAAALTAYFNEYFISFLRSFATKRSRYDEGY